MSTDTARIPGPKSLTNRVLALAAMAGGPSDLRYPLVSDDTRAFADALVALDVPVDRREDRWIVTGTGTGPRSTGSRIWCEDAGTAARFLSPLAAAGHGVFDFDGTDQLRVRPLRPLLDSPQCTAWPVQISVRVACAPQASLAETGGSWGVHSNG